MVRNLDLGNYGSLMGLTCDLRWVLMRWFGILYVPWSNLDWTEPQRGGREQSLHFQRACYMPIIFVSHYILWDGLRKSTANHSLAARFNPTYTAFDMPFLKISEMVMRPWLLFQANISFHRTSTLTSKNNSDWRRYHTVFNWTKSKSSWTIPYNDCFI